MAVVLYLLLSIFVSCQEVKTQEMDDLLKVVGGRNANPGDIPYQVRMSDTPDLTTGCGGIIIDEYHYLTAAHCSNLEKGSYVMVGSVDTTAISDPNRYDTNVDKIFSHHAYKKVTALNDIAIVRIDGKFTWSDFVQPAKMGTGVPPVKTSCEVSGWGWTHPDFKNRPIILQKVQVPITDRQECEVAFKQLEKLIYPKMFCAGYREGEKDACIGDSGGPLTCNGLLVGLVSWGHSCALPNFFGVYTDVLAYDSWIKSTLKESYSEMGKPYPN